MYFGTSPGDIGGLSTYDTGVFGSGTVHAYKSRGGYASDPWNARNQSRQLSGSLRSGWNNGRQGAYFVVPNSSTQRRHGGGGGGRGGKAPLMMSRSYIMGEGEKNALQQQRFRDYVRSGMSPADANRFAMYEVRGAPGQGGNARGGALVAQIERANMESDVKELNGAGRGGQATRLERSWRQRWELPPDSSYQALLDTYQPSWELGKRKSKSPYSAPIGYTLDSWQQTLNPPEAPKVPNPTPAPTPAPGGGNGGAFSGGSSAENPVDDGSENEVR